MVFQDTRANEVIVILTVVLAWVMMARTMMKRPRTDPYAWVTILTCFIVICYAMVLAISWHPEITNCTKHCFPWGN